MNVRINEELSGSDQANWVYNGNVGNVAYITLLFLQPHLLLLWPTALIQEAMIVSTTSPVLLRSSIDSPTNNEPYCWPGPQR